MHEIFREVHEAIFKDQRVEVFDWKNGVYTLEFHNVANMDYSAQLKGFAVGISHLRSLGLVIEEVIQFTPRGGDEPGRNPGVVVLTRNA